MMISLLRHGEASFNAINDESRELTDLGRQQVLSSVSQLRQESVIPINEIWSSPYVRAQQSAEIAASVLQLGVNIQPLLTPDYSPEKVIEWLYTLDKRGSSILLVSHMPLVGSLVSLLVEGNNYAQLPFYTGMIARLDGEEPIEGCFTLNKVFMP